eukprot:scaffold49839_cov20-Tisochrysis_lutea.AAC.2
MSRSCVDEGAKNVCHNEIHDRQFQRRMCTLVEDHFGVKLENVDEGEEGNEEDQDAEGGTKHRPSLEKKFQCVLFTSVVEARIGASLCNARDIIVDAAFIFAARGLLLQRSSQKSAIKHT